MTNDKEAPAPELVPPKVKYRAPLVKADRPNYVCTQDHTVTLTIHYAEAHLELIRFDAERKVIDDHVQFLLDEHRAGRFNWKLVVFVTAELEGKTYSLNGQHTCWMRIFLPPAAEDPTIRHLHYLTHTWEELRTLYGTIDRGKGRSPGHVLKVLTAGNEALPDINLNTISRLGPAYKLWAYELPEVRKRVGAHELAARLTGDHADLAVKVGLCYQRNQDHLHIRRASVLAAMFATFEKAPKAADEFWDRVADGLNLSDRNDARYRLREVLQTYKVDSGKMTVSHEDLYRICVNGWNKWRRNEPAQVTIRTTERRLKPV